ncbi:DUF2934 domain-containing protein [Devosia sp. 2618]|uniref:DUF2934 domain-containing protein n=1 Tax=Devosia sp. 2618 TaxID=3156454 RepID=UPI00339B4CA8
MSADRDEEIRARAYALWQTDGAPEGQDEHYWHKAERELAEESDVDLSEQASEVSATPLPAGTLAR